MGKVSGNWITGTHSGRACKHDDIYTKVNKKTGATYTVKLCNPSRVTSTKQQKGRSAFGLVSSAISAWINNGKSSSSSDYKKVAKMFDAQSLYSTMRGFMMAKGMYTVSSDKTTVTVDITARTDFKTAFGITSSSSSSQNGVTNQPAAKKTLTLTVSPSGAGTVTGAGEYDANATAHITATAADGYTFKKWNDNDTNASRDVTMSSDLTLQAVFETTSSSSGSSGSGGSGWGANNEP